MSLEMKTETTEPKYVYLFGSGQSEGDASEAMRRLLGNKGAHLAQMDRWGFNVPQGFTITTDVCRYYFGTGALPVCLPAQIERGVEWVEGVIGRKFGDTDKNPLLFSARSGAYESMPGMMETILNIGLTDEVADTYRRRHTGDESKERFILDCQQMLYQMYGENVFHIPKEEFNERRESYKTKRGVEHDSKLGPSDLEEIVARFRGLYKSLGFSLPPMPWEQLTSAIIAVEESARGKKACDFKEIEGFEGPILTAVNVQRMVFGNKNNRSATGVGFTRNPSTGIYDEEDPYGEFDIGVQGEVIVGGKRKGEKLRGLKTYLPGAYAQLMENRRILEERTGRVQDYEFTIEGSDDEDGKSELFMLQTRNGKMGGRGTIRSAIDMFREGLSTELDSILRVSPRDVEQLLYKMIDYDAMRLDMENNGQEIDDVTIYSNEDSGASPGAGVGRIFFDVGSILEYKADCERRETAFNAVLCRKETDPSDVKGMVVSKAVVTKEGGQTSHAAIVGRNKGVPCVVGTGLEIDEKARTLSYRDNNGRMIALKEGDVITVDGSAGAIFNYEATLIDPDPYDPDLFGFLDIIIPHAKMRVYANANNADECMMALQYNVEGIGLARTEYMFLEDVLPGEDRELTIQMYVLSEDEKTKREALARLEGMQRRDFLEMYGVMGERPIIIRFLDYPMHELMPKNEEEKEEHWEKLASGLGITREKLRETLEGFSEINPMLGWRSVRLGITNPDIYSMQARAILSAAHQHNSSLRSVGKEEGYVTPYIEIPLVTLPSEVDFVERLVSREAEAIGFARGGSSSKDENRYRFSIMYELAGACFMAPELAERTDCGSFGTNDLTQTTEGISREDGRKNFLTEYTKKGIIKRDPFVTIDKDGPVARAMAYAMLAARSIKPDYEFGICGVHAGDPESLEICYGLGLDNVSPPAKQAPVSWLVSAQLSMTKEHGWMLEEYRDHLRKIVGQ